MCVSDLSLCPPFCLCLIHFCSPCQEFRSHPSPTVSVSNFCLALSLSLSLSLSHSLPLFFSRVLSHSQASCLQISSVNLLLNYSRTSVPEERFRLLVEENGLKREKVREWGFRWKEEMSFVTKDVLMRWFMSYRGRKKGLHWSSSQRRKIHQIIKWPRRQLQVERESWRLINSTMYLSLTSHSCARSAASWRKPPLSDWLMHDT